jgi:hypothetical protein
MSNQGGGWVRVRFNKRHPPTHTLTPSHHPHSHSQSECGFSYDSTRCRIDHRNTIDNNMSLKSTDFVQLLLFQMALITSRSFLNFNCVITDMILNVLFTSGEWLNACVAAERMLIIIQGINFNKKRSQRRAKWVILMAILLTALTYLHVLFIAT